MEPQGGVFGEEAGVYTACVSEGGKLIRVCAGHVKVVQVGDEVQQLVPNRGDGAEVGGFGDVLS
jgi:ethanolamine utilization protein EutA (predicted chaperonin)